MAINIIEKPLRLHLHGFSGTAANGNYSATAFALMNRMWPLLKSQGLRNKGLNIWVYEPGNRIFAGIELEDAAPDTSLETKTIELARYAFYKHVGSYGLIKDAGRRMREELQSKGYAIVAPYVEIYGHHSNDESKLETDLLMALG